MNNAPLPVGSILLGAGGDRIEISSLLGWGGYGFVYRAKNVQTGDDIVVKLLRPDVIAANPDAVEQFAREATAAQRIDHPNVARIRAYVGGDVSGVGIPYLVMDYIGGGDLEDALSSWHGSPIDWAILLDWMAQLANGLEAIHRHVLHRDLKPKNVLIDGSTLKITDFGMAKYIEEATRTITAKGLGTSHYKAPETWRYDRATISTDIYSLGIMFYQMATLCLPYSGRDAAELRQAHLTARIPRVSEVRPDIDERLDGMIVKMMAKDARDRYQSAVDVAGMIVQVAAVPLSPLPPGVATIVREARNTFDRQQEARAVQESHMEEHMETVQLINFQMGEFADLLDRLVEDLNARLPEHPVDIRKDTDDRFVGRRDARVFAYGYRTLSLSFFDLPTTVVYVDQSPVVAVGTLALGKWKNEVTSTAGFTVGLARPIDEPYIKGLHILLARSPDETYGRWQTCEIKENALYATNQRRLAREQVTFPTLDLVLGQVREISVLSAHDTTVRDFKDDDFYQLLRLVVS